MQPEELTKCGIEGREDTLMLISFLSDNMTPMKTSYFLVLLSRLEKVLTRRSGKTDCVDCDMIFSEI